MTWNANDEQEMRRCEERLQEMRSKRKSYIAALKDILERIGLDEGYLSDAAVERVIQRADALRDALQPFDSGVRNAKEE